MRLVKIIPLFALVFMLGACDELFEESEPEAELDEITVEDNTIEFDLHVDDGSDTIEFISARLMHEDEEVVDLNNEDHDLPTDGTVSGNEFFHLDAREYTIEVYAEYEFEDEHYETVLDAEDVVIEPLNELPESDMQDIEIDEESIIFDLEIVDEDDAIEGLRVYLRDEDGDEMSELTLEDGLGVGLNEGVFFEGLEADTAYEVEVAVAYNDGYETRYEVLETYPFDTEE